MIERLSAHGKACQIFVVDSNRKYFLAGEPSFAPFAAEDLIRNPPGCILIPIDTTPDQP